MRPTFDRIMPPGTRLVILNLLTRDIGRASTIMLCVLLPTGYIRMLV